MLPTLSIVVPTTQPWPAAEACLDLLLPQARDNAAEILLAVSIASGLPDPPPPPVRYIHVPGASVFELRAHATRCATAPVIAWTEDHCRPAADWCRAILQAHEAYPDAELIGGSVHNGSTERPFDWANFLNTFGPFVPPLHHRIGRVPVAANLSFKRSALPLGDLPAGFLELIQERAVQKRGGVKLVNEIQVTHVQTWGFWGTPIVHFHNGRCTTGLIAARMSEAEWWHRLALCVPMPVEILRTAVLPLRNKPQIPVWRHLPFMAVLAGAHSLGELTGLLTRSAGNSPLALE